VKTQFSEDRGDSIQTYFELARYVESSVCASAAAAAEATEVGGGCRWYLMRTAARRGDERWFTDW